MPAFLLPWVQNLTDGLVAVDVVIVGIPTFQRTDQFKGGLVDTRATGAATTTARAAAALGNVVASASQDVVVGNVAAVRSLIPEGVSVDVGARGLAGNAKLGTLSIGLDDAVAGAGTRAAVKTIGLDRVGAGQGQRDGSGQGKGREVHDESG